VREPIGNGALQSYPAAPGNAPWILDSNFLANGYSSGQLSARTITHESGNIYLVETINQADTGTAPTQTQYKQFPMIGWAGRNNMLDVSGPSSATTLAATSYGMCFVYNADECYSASTVGQVYVNVPWMFDQGSCTSEQQVYNSPCVELGWPGVGAFRQAAWDRQEVQGARSRLLTYGFGGPGQPGPFTEAFPISRAQAYIPPSGPSTPFGNTAWIAQLPTWLEDTQNRTVGGGITVQVPSGAGAYARVQFGYSRFSQGTPANFYCSGRAEACNTSTASGSPYSFDGETGTTATPCSAGCTIAVPAMAPNLVYWQIQVSPNGTTWTNWGDVEANAVP
jgi:hypothetical protein